jgi:putative thioredoxin
MKNIIEVTELNFEPEVMLYSKSNLVVLDFWAEWCHPCKVLELILEKLASEESHPFRLARLNVDENPNLAIRFNVSSIPTIKVISSGQVVAELVGNQPEPRLRDFIAKIPPPSPSGLELEKAESMLQDHDWRKAEEIFRSVLTAQPDLPKGLLGLAISLLAQASPDEAEVILRNFPASKEYSRAQALLPYARSLLDKEPGVISSADDLDIAFKHSIEFARKGKFELAVEGLLDILRQDRHYRKDLAKNIIVSLLELLGPEHPDSRAYRSELAMILY